MKPRILIIEDDPALGRLLSYNLDAAGYSTILCIRGDDAMATIADEAPDLVVLDWMLPGMSGIEICRQIRASKAIAALPVLMLTARGEEDERVRGLTTGADDYMVKPFSVAELIARIKGLLRRASPEQVKEVVEIGDLRLDRAAKNATRGERPLRLSPMEFRLLDLFVTHPGRVYSRAQLLDAVWGRDTEAAERTVDVTIGRLRKNLTHAGERDVIHTLRGEGYTFRL